MLKKLLLVTLCAVSVSFMAGCSDNNDPAGPEQVDGPTDGIIPLNIDAQWSYRQWNNADTTTYVELITGVETFGDIDHYTRGHQKSGEYAVYDAIRILDDRLQIYPIISNAIYADYFYELPYPASVGDEFTYYTDSDYKITGKVMSTGEDVTIALGTFTCYHYYIWLNEDYADIYYCPGVGLIKEVSVEDASLESLGVRYTELIETANIDY